MRINKKFSNYSADQLRAEAASRRKHGEFLKANGQARRGGRFVAYANALMDQVRSKEFHPGDWDYHQSHVGPVTSGR